MISSVEDTPNQYYENVYSRDKRQHFLKYREGQLLSNAHELALQWLSENDTRYGNILDFGCGECEFLEALQQANEKVGIDYSESALINANKKYKNLNLHLGSVELLSNFERSMDIVFSFGTLEHLKNPKDVFRKLVACLKTRGVLIVSCPSFLNVRGVIWMTLVKLFKVPMSLSDIHFLSINDFKCYAQESEIKLIKCASVDHDFAQGDFFRKDMQKRLTNALRDSNMDNSNVDELINWVEDHMPYFPNTELSGAETVYMFQKFN